MNTHTCPHIIILTYTHIQYIRVYMRTTCTHSCTHVPAYTNTHIHMYARKLHTSPENFLYDALCVRQLLVAFFIRLTMWTQDTQHFFIESVLYFRILCKFVQCHSSCGGCLWKQRLVRIQLSLFYSGFIKMV